MTKYALEFTLQSRSAAKEFLRNSLVEFGENLEISLCGNPGQAGKDFKIDIITEDPTLIFDICSQFGRIKAVKIDEFRKNLEGNQKKDV